MCDYIVTVSSLSTPPASIIAVHASSQDHRCPRDSISAVHMTVSALSTPPACIARRSESLSVCILCLSACAQLTNCFVSHKFHMCNRLLRAVHLSVTVTGSHCIKLASLQFISYSCASLQFVSCSCASL